MPCKIAYNELIRTHKNLKKQNKTKQKQKQWGAWDNIQPMQNAGKMY